MNKLKPCPFCGSTYIKMYSDKNPNLHGYIHLCDSKEYNDTMSKIENRLFKSDEDAIKHWNTRVGEQ